MGRIFSRKTNYINTRIAHFELFCKGLQLMIVLIMDESVDIISLTRFNRLTKSWRPQIEQTDIRRGFRERTDFIKELTFGCQLCLHHSPQTSLLLQFVSFLFLHPELNQVRTSGGYWRGCESLNSDDDEEEPGVESGVLQFTPDLLPDVSPQIILKLKFNSLSGILIFSDASYFKTPSYVLDVNS